MVIINLSRVRIVVPIYERESGYGDPLTTHCHIMYV